MDYKSIIMAQAFGGDGGGGTEVIANPTLEGTEEGLNGLQVGETKYKVGKQLYRHTVCVRLTGSTNSNAICTIVCDKSDAFTLETLAQFIKDSGFTNANNNAGGKVYPCSGFSFSFSQCTYGLFWNSATSEFKAASAKITTTVAPSYATDTVISLVYDIINAL